MLDPGDKPVFSYGKECNESKRKKMSLVTVTKLQPGDKLVASRGDTGKTAPASKGSKNMILKIILKIVLKIILKDILKIILKIIFSLNKNVQHILSNDIELTT